jgi:hypothetical protein
MRRLLLVLMFAVLAQPTLAMRPDNGERDDKRPGCAQLLP